jgi:hypothetical protein
VALRQEDLGEDRSLLEARALVVEQHLLLQVAQARVEGFPLARAVLGQLAEQPHLMLVVQKWMARVLLREAHLT